MEVKPSEWIIKARMRIDIYLCRGGYLKGDEPQLLEGSDLLNTIGTAMSLPVENPREWSDKDEEEAKKSKHVYYVGDARKVIDVIVDQIKHCCNGNEKCYITVLPIELYLEGKLLELPLFRVQRYKNSKIYYVDNVGRSYDSYSDWYNNNKLPSCYVAIPHNLTLKLQPGYDYSHVAIIETPSHRIESTMVKGVDIAASAAGIGSSIGLLFVTGGLATPLVMTGVATAIWGTTRTGYQLIDKASHGENINPLNNSENRRLWLGMATNIVAFGLMGASMRLTSLAVRGRNISNTLKLIVNVTTGSHVVLSGATAIDTTMHLVESYDEMSTVDVLSHVVSVAFWSKGLFTYKTAGTLKKNAQDYVFKMIRNEINPEDAHRLSAFRSQFNNDAQLLRQFHTASKQGIFTETFFQIVFDSASIHGNVPFDGKGNLVFRGGQTYSIQFLSTLSQNVRKHYLDIITHLRSDQVALLESLRRRLNNDRVLVSGLCNIAEHFRLSPRVATEQVLNFWGRYSQINTPTTPNISFRDGSLLLGRAPSLQLNVLRKLSEPMIRFVGEHLASMNEAISRQWTNSIPVLQHLESQGMFSICTVNQTVPTGRAVVLLNSNLQISIYKLKGMESNDCRNMLTMIGQLRINVEGTHIPENLKTLVRKYRLRLECHRKESLSWLTVNTSRNLLPILRSNLQNYEKDRLITFQSTVATARAMPYMNNMMRFISNMNPRNVSEMVSYGEYVITCVEATKRNLEGELRSGRLQLPKNTNKATFLRQKASEAIFNDTSALRRKWNTTIDLVRSNSMVGPASLTSGLSDDALVSAMRRIRIGFGSQASAAYHVLKHPTDPPSAYVDRANEIIRSAERWQATLTQDGDARSLRFESPKGSAIVLERDGSVLLCTFTPKSANL